MTSKKLFVFAAIVVLIATFAIAAFAQADAGFLERPPQPGDPLWAGTGWYCVDGAWPNQYIVAGPFPAQPDCSGY